jgi:hypothetical protein
LEAYKEEKKMITLKDISKLKLTKKQRKKLLAKGKLRDPLEIWVDHHNHKLEIIRTCSSLLSAIVSSLVLLKVFSIL